ncbi:MAG: NfeD family protein [Bacteroidota bacterium]
MEWATIITLIFFGLALMIVEIIFVPGTTLIGVAGFVFMGLGVWFAFSNFGREAGWITLAGTTVASGLLLYFSFKSNVWGRFALKSVIDSKVNEGVPRPFETGQEGVAISALRPIGKAEVNNQTVEVKTLGGYLEPGTRIRIVKVLPNQIIVEPIN